MAVEFFGAESGEMMRRVLMFSNVREVSHEFVKEAK